MMNVEDIIGVAARFAGGDAAPVAGETAGSSAVPVTGEPANGKAVPANGCFAARMVTGRPYVDAVLKREAVQTFVARTVPGIIFVKTSPERVTTIASECCGKLFFYRNPERTAPQMIEERQMRNFMLVASVPDTDLLLLKDEGHSFSCGQKVRVTGGIFEGAEGVVKRIKGDRRLLVSIDGVAVIATPFIHPSLLEAVE